jgi:predicted ATP-grasp superfamily ATP-dependent carboligase
MPLDSLDPAGVPPLAGSIAPGGEPGGVPDLLILGASARAAAYSALRAGLRPVCADLFADRDLTAVCPASLVPRARYPGGFARIAAQAPACPWLYTGALENHPDLIDRIARGRVLWGNGGAGLRAVRDPIAVAAALRRAGLTAPDVRSDPEGLPRDGSWLVKPLASAGGQGIHPLGRTTGPPKRPSYYQERVAGPSLSAVFVGRRDGAALAGVTRQWVGRPGAPFAYVGSVGPWTVPAEVEARVEAVGRVLASSFGLVGLFGIDFIRRGGYPWPVEVNPRYAASVEVLELALGRSLLAEHRRACDPEVEVRVNPAVAGREGRPPVVGKLIVFAVEPCRFPDRCEWHPHSDDPFAIPRLGDVPQPGTRFEAGEPVLTLFAAGANAGECRDHLARETARWHWRLSR